MAVTAEPALAEILAEVRRIEVFGRRLARGVITGGYVSAFRGGGLEFDTVREYAEGDDPRAVDWNVTARMGRPFVKTYVEERERTVLFLLDLSASMTGGFGAWSLREAAARVVACLALSAVDSGDRVGLVAFSQGVETYVPPRKGLSHALRIVRDALALPASGSGTDPAAALEHVARAVRRHAIVFLVSDFLSGRLEPALSRCARRHDLVAVRLSPPELIAPSRGLLRVRDPESGAEGVIDFSSARVRSAYAARIAAHLAATEATLARARVDLLDVSVPRAPSKDAVAGPLLRFFRMRELRGAKR